MNEVPHDAGLLALGQLLGVLVAHVLEHVGGGVGVRVPAHGVAADAAHCPPPLLRVEVEVQPHHRRPRPSGTRWLLPGQRRLGRFGRRLG